MKIIQETLRAHYKISITFQAYRGSQFYWWSIYKIVYLIDRNKGKKTII